MEMEHDSEVNEHIIGRKRKIAFFAMAMTAMVAVCTVVGALADKTPRHDSIRSGGQLVQELLESDNIGRFRAMARMNKGTFRKLVKYLRKNGLKDNRYITAEEKLLMTLQIVGTGCSYATCMETFQHSGSTVSACFDEVIACICSCKHELFQHRDPNIVQPEIARNYRFANYFANCIGALDGSHIEAIIPDAIKQPWRDREGNITQNILGVVNFDMTFSFVLPGWEGSAHDGRLVESAFHHGLVCPEGKYYLGDAGFTNSMSILTPFRGVRYHLKEFKRGNRGPQTVHELYNLRHSSLRNVVERTFGVLKRRFRVLRNMNAYAILLQAKIVLACCLLHNFIRMDETSDDWIFKSVDKEKTPSRGPHRYGNHSAEKRLARINRENIAQDMWHDYLEYKQGKAQYTI